MGMALRTTNTVTTPSSNLSYPAILTAASLRSRRPLRFALQWCSPIPRACRRSARGPARSARRPAASSQPAPMESDLLPDTYIQTYDRSQCSAMAADWATGAGLVTWPKGPLCSRAARGNPLALRDCDANADRHLLRPRQRRPPRPRARGLSPRPGTRALVLPRPGRRDQGD